MIVYGLITYSAYGSPSNEGPGFIGNYTFGNNSIFDRDSAYELFSSPPQYSNLYDGINGGPEFGNANCKGLL